MKINTDTSGLDELLNTIIQAQQEIPDMNKQFLKDEFAHFAAEVAIYTPVDTGQLADSFDTTEPVTEGDITSAEWMNYAPYASFVNEGFTHYISGEFVTPREKPLFFWLRGMNKAAIGREERYQEKFAKKFEK